MCIRDSNNGAKTHQTPSSSHPLLTFLQFPCYIPSYGWKSLGDDVYYWNSDEDHRPKGNTPINGLSLQNSGDVQQGKFVMLESPERLSRMNVISVGRELINVKMYLYNGTYAKRCLVNLNRLPVGRFGSTSALSKEV